MSGSFGEAMQAVCVFVGWLGDMVSCITVRCCDLRKTLHDSRARCPSARRPISRSALSSQQECQTHVRQGPGGVSFRQELGGGGNNWQPAEGEPASTLTVFVRSNSAT